MDKWITVKELAVLKGISERGVRKSFGTNKYVTRKYGKSYEILVSSLEIEIQEIIKDFEKSSASAEMQAENYLASPENRQTEQTVPEKAKTLALAKYDLIKEWDKFRSQQVNRTEAGKDFLNLYNQKIIHKNLYTIIGTVKIGTIYEWHKKLRANGDDWHCLICGYNYDEFNSKTSLRPQEESLFLEILLSRNKINIGKAARLTKHILSERGIKNISCDMSYRRFANNFQKMKNFINKSTMILFRQLNRRSK